MSAPLPDWAEDVVRRWGPQPAAGRTAPNEHAAARYSAIIARFRSRWHAELEPGVWRPLFTGHEQQAKVLLGIMIDLARWGSVKEFKASRQALDDLQRVEDELRELAAQVARKLALRGDLMHDFLLDGDLDDDVTAAFGAAADAMRAQSWGEPRHAGAGFAAATASRKGQRDALNILLWELDGCANLLQPVKLTDAARAAIFNVINDVGGDEGYGAAAIKKARADLRRLR